MSKTHTTTAFVANGPWSEDTRKNPAIKFFEIAATQFFDTGDHSKYKDFWTENFSSTTPHGTHHKNGREDTKSTAVETFYSGPLSKWEHEAEYQVAIETSKGWDLSSSCHLFANVVGDAHSSEDKVKDSTGQAWDIVIPVFYRVDLHNDPNAPHGMKIDHITVIRDTGIIDAKLHKRGHGHHEDRLTANYNYQIATYRKMKLRVITMLPSLEPSSFILGEALRDWLHSLRKLYLRGTLVANTNQLARNKPSKMYRLLNTLMVVVCWLSRVEATTTQVTSAQPCIGSGEAADIALRWLQIFQTDSKGIGTGSALVTSTLTPNFTYYDEGASFGKPGPVYKSRAQVRKVVTSSGYSGDLVTNVHYTLFYTFSACDVVTLRWQSNSKSSTAKSVTVPVGTPIQYLGTDYLQVDLTSRRIYNATSSSDLLNYYIQLGDDVIKQMMH